MSKNTKFRPLIIFGTSSGAGKSLIATALLRIFSDMGIDAVPFKVQNMSLNAGVGYGGEMAYAQIIQARAARVYPSVLMNPILLKPENKKTHVVVMGKHYGTFSALKYMNDKKEEIYKIALNCFRKLQSEHELVIIEGTGSPVEINLENDIANVRIAKDVKAKGLLVADIERGGVFASIVGTLELIDFKEIIGIIVNKFRGEESLLYKGYEFIERKYGIPFLGTVPYIDHNLPEEDSLANWTRRNGEINIKIIKLPHIANFTDFEIFESIEDVGITYATKPEDLNNSDIIILPGTKLTVPDLEYIRREGFEDKILKEHREGAFVIGICGGYQMLGKYIIDNVESRKGKVNGINLLEDSKTVFSSSKRTNRIFGYVLHPNFKGIKIEGYEIHMGITTSVNHFSEIYRVGNQYVKQFDGSFRKNVFGTYFHGLFDNIKFTEALINYIREKKGLDKISLKAESLDEKINKIARIVKRKVNVEKIIESIKMN